MNRVLPAIVALALLVYAVIDLFQTDTSRIKTFNRVVWLAIIVLIPIIGPVLWLTVAKHPSQPRPTPRRPTPPVAPDDDPEFLRQLKDLDGEHEKMLDDWESDLRRREEEMRRRSEGNGDDDSRT